MNEKEYWMHTYGINSAQLTDYQKAFERILQLISHADPLNLLWLCPPEEYDIEAQAILKELWQVETAEEALSLIERVFKEWLQYEDTFPSTMGRMLLSIKDMYIWPLSAYDTSME